MNEANKAPVTEMDEAVLHEEIVNIDHDGYVEFINNHTFADCSVIGATGGVEVYGSNEQVAEMFADYAAYYGEVKNGVADTKNEFYKSKYMTLDQVLDIARPILSKYGLAVFQVPTAQDKTLSMINIMTHKSGAAMVFPEMKMAIAQLTPQGAIAAVTYARRGTFCSLFGIAADIDDDGNAASGNVPKGTTVKKSDKSIGDLEKAQAELIDLGKAKMAAGVAKEVVHNVVKKHCGTINPNAAKTVEACKAAIEEMKKL